MDIVNGKQRRRMDRAEFAAWAAGFEEIAIDLGCGDGRFVRESARQRPDAGFVGVDLCPANPRGSSRAAPGNALFVVADVLALPEELHGTATRLTVNFPWGGLLRGLLDGHPGLMEGLRAVGRGNARCEFAVNAGALAEAGWPLDRGGDRIAEALRVGGFDVRPALLLCPEDLRRFPTSWAKRLAFGRDPRAVRIVARLQDDAVSHPRVARGEGRHLPASCDTASELIA